jgi:primosomal protein N' (replication factor Y) (superfamily II helicase)
MADDVVTPTLVVRVVPDVSGLEKVFDYLVPEKFRGQVRVGTQVRIPLNGRRVGGWVVEVLDGSTAEAESTVAVDRLKPIAMVSGYGPSGDVISLARWAAWRWCGPFRAVMRTASPPLVVRHLPSPRHGRRGGVADPVATALLREAAAELAASPLEGDPAPVTTAASSTVDTATSLTVPADDAAPRLLRFPPCASRVPVIVAAAEMGPTLVVLPSVDTARVFAARLRTHGLTVAVIPDDWAAAAGGVDVVIGARTTVWATCPDLCSIVILDEHDESLQDERSPTWVARDVAIERARRLRIPCLLVSPSPSIAAIESATPVRSVSRLAERDGWPLVEIVDRSEEEPWKTSLISSPLAQHLRNQNCRVVCVLNTVGRSKRLACRSCRELTVCERCKATVHEPEPGVLHCARCDTVRPRICQACGGASLANLRPGVSRLREELEAAAARPVVEVTAALGDDFPSDAGVYVGTEAVLHRVRSADVVAFLDIDSELLAPRYRAAEQAMTLLVRAARLVGPRSGGGRLLIHTRFADHEVIDAARHAAPERLAEIERDAREALGFPPFGALASVSGVGADEFVASLPKSVMRASPSDGHWLLRASTSEVLADALRANARPPASRIRVAVDPSRV